MWHIFTSLQCISFLHNLSETFITSLAVFVIKTLTIISEFRTLFLSMEGLNNLHNYQNIKYEDHCSLKSSLFSDVTRRRLVVRDRRLTIYRSHLQGLSSPRTCTAWPMGCFQMSATYQQSTLFNVPEEQRSRLDRGGSLKSRLLLHQQA
jgi:hypothetical protein